MATIIGRIEFPTKEAAETASPVWLALVDKHDSLGHVPPRPGINPFTRQPCDYNAPASTAVVSFSGGRAGSIWWAMDGSPMLIWMQSQALKKR